NVFIDRGAFDRVDVLGPTAALVTPLDNDPAHLDQDLTVGNVTLSGQKVTKFSIHLIDAGVGVDDSTVTVGQFTIIFNGDKLDNTGADCALSYENTNKSAQLIPKEGVWASGTYKITLNNSAVDGIKDLAGNPLQPAGDFPPFTIQLNTAATSPFQNATNR